MIFHSIAIAQTSWYTNGNTGSYSNFIGTTNNYPFLFRTNNIERFRIQPNGFVGIGVANPTQRLDIFGNLRVRGNIYVNQNVYQQGQFDADSIDAGLINASNLNANYLNTDSLRSYVIMMDQQSKFVGQSNFENSVKVNDKLVIGETANYEPSEKFEVHGGNAKFFGDVKLNQRLVFGDNQHGFTFIPSTETNNTNYLRFGDDPIGIPNFNYCNYPKFNVELDVQGEFKVFKETAEGDIHTLSMFCDGPNSIIEMAGTNGNESGGPSLLLNYYCGKDIHDVTGSNGGKLVVGKPQNTNLAFNVRGNSVLEGNLDVWGTTWLNGSVRIGNDNSTVGDTKLAVEGIVLAREVKVTQGIIWPDYVFKKNYKLLSLNETENFILENGHLPEIPSADEIKISGLSLADMLTMQMKKIEELTLYVIEQQKQIEELKQNIKK